MSTLRSIQDRSAAIRRMMRSTGRDVGMSDPADLVELVAFARLADELLADAVREQRTHGYSDREIGQALGVTRAAVSKRWPGDGTYVGAAGRYRKTAAAEVVA